MSPLYIPPLGHTRPQLPGMRSGSALSQLFQEKLQIEVQNKTCCLLDDAARNRTQDYVPSIPSTARKHLLWLWVKSENTATSIFHFLRALSPKCWTFHLEQSPLNCAHFSVEVGRGAAMSLILWFYVLDSLPCLFASLILHWKKNNVKVILFFPIFELILGVLD